VALGLPTDQRSQIMLLLVVVAATGGYFFWTKVHAPMAQKIGAASTEADSLQGIIDKAKVDLASGTVEDLRRKVEQYEAMLGLMRRLVPEKNEVPALIDDISTKAKVRGINIGRFEPLSVEPGSPFDTHRYRMEVLGNYDEVGEFLADIASLPRIIVPQDVTLRLASQAAQRVTQDTAGALLEMSFMIRTFVKAAPPPGAQGGARRAGGSE
jgi:type IV pilus assembly protein PilO